MRWLSAPWRSIPSPFPPPLGLGLLLCPVPHCLWAGPATQHLLSIYTEDPSGIFSHVLLFLFAGVFLVKGFRSGFNIEVNFLSASSHFPPSFGGIWDNTTTKNPALKPMDWPTNRSFFFFWAPGLCTLERNSVTLLKHVSEESHTSHEPMLETMSEHKSI